MGSFAGLVSLSCMAILSYVPLMRAPLRWFIRHLVSLAGQRHCYAEVREIRA